MKPPQALTTTYPTRVARFYTALVAPPGGVPNAPLSERRTKRGTAAVNYAELDVDDERDPSERAAAAASANETVDPSQPPERAQAPVDVPPKLVQRVSLPYRSEKTLAGAGALPTVLIPIRLDLDLERGRLHDTFLWNLHETLITPEMFGEQMAADLDLPKSVAATIGAAIREQLAEYAPVAQISLPESSGEMRAVCNLVVNHDHVQYVDRFEWDLTNAFLPPETFARRIAADLGLRSEFVPAIAAGIYEFSLQKKKDLYESGIPELEVFAHRTDGSDAGWRLDNEGLCTDWEPKVELLTREEIEKREIDREREVRRLRRETARFGTGPIAAGDGGDELGRGGRGRVRKRQRSASPTPVGNEDWERGGWRCQWCGISGTSSWGIGDGPDGPKTLCFNCGYMYRERGGLELWAKNMHYRVRP